MSASRLLGVTEPFWATLPEGRRLYWKHFMRAAAMGLALLVSRTGNAYVDWTIGALTTVFYAIVIETQRTYSRLPPCPRKTNIRVAIFLGSMGVVLVGVAWFLQVGLGAFSEVWMQELGQASVAQHQTTKLMVAALIVITFPLAMINVFRGLQVEQLIWHLPRKGLKTLLICKEPKAHSFHAFASFEIGVLVACGIYACAVAELWRFFAVVVAVAIRT